MKESSNGVRSTVDLGALLNISDQTPIQAFDVQQAPNLSLFMVIATAASDQKSNVLVVKNFVLTDNLSVTVRPIQQVSTVYSVYIVRSSHRQRESSSRSHKPGTTEFGFKRLEVSNGCTHASAPRTIYERFRHYALKCYS